MSVFILMFVPCIVRRSRNNQANAQICSTASLYMLAPTVYLLAFHAHFLLGILSFKWLIARRLYKSFGVKGLTGNYAGVNRQDAKSYQI
jgi:hypothetical protein